MAGIFEQLADSLSELITVREIYLIEKEKLQYIPDQKTHALIQVVFTAVIPELLQLIFFKLDLIRFKYLNVVGVKFVYNQFNHPNLRLKMDNALDASLSYDES